VILEIIVPEKTEDPYVIYYLPYMPVKSLPYKSIEQLIRKNLSVQEWEPTSELIKKLRNAKKRGWLTKNELIEICRWKSARAIRHILSNRPTFIKEITLSAFKTRSEQLKMIELRKLKGVSIPMASAILTLTNPRRYGVIDIRVWELMFHIGTMSTNLKGVNFTFNQWYRYLMILRHFADKLKVNARDIERTLFLVHKKYQEGSLYKNL
jgi:hypothetical protein